MWRARRAIKDLSMRTPTKDVFLEETSGLKCTGFSECRKEVRYIQSEHMNTYKLWDIAYSFLIGGDARVYEGRGWKRARSFDPGYNHISHSFAFMGNFSKIPVSIRIIDKIYSLIECGKSLVSFQIINLSLKYD